MATHDDLPERFRHYCISPPCGSALARAITHGIDPTITFYNMFALTGEERLERAGRLIQSAQSIARMREARTS